MKYLNFRDLFLYMRVRDYYSSDLRYSRASRISIDRIEIPTSTIKKILEDYI